MTFDPNMPFDLGLPTPEPQVPQAQTIPEETVEKVKVEVSIEPEKKIEFRKLHPDKFIITQSDMKMVIRKGEEIPHCPLQFMEIKVLRNFKRIETLSEMCGCYFETLCLGSSAGGRTTLDLPRKTLTQKAYREMIAKGIPENEIMGGKTIDQERIEQQAMRFPQRCNDLKITINSENTQVPILKHLWDNVYLAGELDIWPTLILTPEGLTWTIIDLKLTGDVYNRWGDFCWGSPELMDHTQGHVYHELIRDIDLNLNPHLKPMYESMPYVFDKANNKEFAFYYWVWGYKKEPLHMQEKSNIRVRYGDLERKELMESIRKYVVLVNHYAMMPEIPTTPCYHFCHNCPVSALQGGYCTKTTLTQEV